MYRLSRFSLGVGDRFAHQTKAQLEACVLAFRQGVDVTPVWNKSNREHTILGSEPDSVRDAAVSAVKELGWTRKFFCDADHVTFETVDRFIDPCDFFTIDLADFIGKPAGTRVIEDFVKKHGELVGTHQLGDIDEGAVIITREHLSKTAAKFLYAVEEAARVYRKIESAKGKGNFVTEITMDETDVSQTPAELLILLAAIADEGIPLQTIAPRFSGRFSKGVDYVGDPKQFARELAQDMAAIHCAVATYGLPANLKLSVHSGGDKFSIFPAIHECMRKFRTGVHLKTTTWVDELIGLAEAGGSALAMAKEIYAEAYSHRAELCAPYVTVTDIREDQLPAPMEVARWTSEQFTSALRHNPADPAYNPSFRQLLHVGYKVAAKMGTRYLDMVQAHEEVIARNVTENLYNRHIVPVFLGR